MAWINLAAIFVGPLVAVAITLWHAQYKHKRDAKMWLFMRMMASRKSWPPATEWVDSLNQIDFIFYDVPAVVAAWHTFYDSLDRPVEQINMQSCSHKRLDLLHEMAKSLGYPAMKQTDIDRFYTPVQFGHSSTLNSGIQYELLRVLEATSRFETVPKEVEPVPEGIAQQQPAKTIARRTSRKGND